MARSLIALMVVGLAAVACNAEGGDATTTSADPTATSEAVATTTTVDVVETTTTTAATGGPDCLVGTWALDSEEFVAEMAEIFAGAGMPDADITPLEGDFTIELSEEGNLRAVRDHWGFEIAAADSTFRIEITGEETGTWSADDSTLTVSTDVSDLVANSSILVDGEELPMPEGLAPGIPETIATNSEYSCDGDVLTISNEGVTSTLNRS